jgi:hypothetical protein
VPTTWQCPFCGHVQHRCICSTPLTGEDHVKIYLAARYNGNRADPSSGNPNQAAAGSEEYPYHLESYHYVGKGQHDRIIRQNGHQIFMDSGAFSMFTLGSTVNLDAYARFMSTRSDYIEVASNVDAIGAGKEQESYDNQKYLESLKLPVPVCPVHHARDRDEWLVKYLDEGYEYLFLGGMVPETTGYLIDWLDHIWDKYLANPDGTARIKIHGFGLTTFELMDRYPWFSVDSTSWVMISMFGNILMNVGGKPRAVSFSEKSPTTKQEGKSFWSLDAATQDHLRAVLAEEGFKPEELAINYGMRDKWNIRFFRRYMSKPRPVFERRAVTFF